MKYLFCALIGYTIGTINPSYLLARSQGFDIRKKGSGNAGASNALILFGKVAGLLCALFDIAKAFVAVLLTAFLFPALPIVFPVTAVSCIAGHVFPFYMKFKGGKGLASLGGVILYFDWRVFLVLLAIELVVVLITDYICFVPITASVIFPIIYAWLRRDIIGALILGIASPIIIGKHIENLKRIRRGTEVHFSYLWKPKSEIERMKNALPEDADRIDDRLSR